MKDEADALAAGDQLGPYRLDQQLGEGAVGVVYRAVVGSTGEVVAVKVMRKRLARDAVYQKRFMHEARAAAEVASPHLVKIRAAGEHAGHNFLVMDYVQGKSLAELLDAGPLPVQDLVTIARQIATGLDALHQNELIHRDVKPSNILVSDTGVAALTDFGLAKGRAYTVLTRPGELMGTLDYLAPELFRGKPASAASDIYAFGCVAYECATGSPPFAGRSMFSIGNAHLEEDPVPPVQHRAELPADLSWAILQALAKDPARRPRTATTYARLLKVAAR